MKRKPRWPKKARRKNTIEGENSNNRTRMKRNFPISTCMRCGLEGHKSKGCNNGGVPPKPKKWKLSPEVVVTPTVVATTKKIVY